MVSAMPSFNLKQVSTGHELYLSCCHVLYVEIEVQLMLMHVLAWPSSIAHTLMINHPPLSNKRYHSFDQYLALLCSTDFLFTSWSLLMNCLALLFVLRLPWGFRNDGI